MGRIRMRLKNFILNKCSLNFLQSLLNYKYQNYANLSFSQEGEDMVLSRFLETQVRGFFVDIGAHHPIRFSNTYKFYLKGWRGINIDAKPGSMDAFKQIRPFDINLESAISESPQLLTYYEFNEPALNTLSESEAKRKDGLNNYKIINKVTLETKTLKSILDTHLPVGTMIDFMTVDVEGLDLQVLKSNDWNIYRPKLLLVESLRENLEDIKNNDIYKYLITKEYILVARTFNTMFFKQNS